jgi:DNA-binding response OmpR family regulator
MTDLSAGRTRPEGTGSPGGTATILTIEDEPQLLALLGRLLTEAGFAVRGAATGTDGLHLALDLRPDLVVLDVGLPDRSGFEVATELRRRAVRVPILMLTARDTVHDKVEGLGAGADDYLAKPFDASELVARVRALLRRAALREDELRIRVADIELDTVARRVTRGGSEIGLTATEYALLEYLMRNAGREVSREMIAANVWKQPLDPESNIVDVYITYLRKKLDVDGRPKLLHTVRGVGYVLRAEPAPPE